MKRYLEGYLASIPESDYQSMLSSLKTLAGDAGLNETEIEQGLISLRTQYAPLTPDLTCLPLETPVDTCDRVFPYLQIDLAYLYKLIDLLDIAIRRYRDLSLSHLKRARMEIESLRIELEKQKKIKDAASGHTIVTEEFSDTALMEVMTEANSHLFQDRDGRILPEAQMIRRNAEDMLTLAVVSDVDTLHADSGIGKGRIDVLDFRGIPEPTLYGRANAIDGSADSYWEILCNESRPILSGMYGNQPGGAYLRFRLTLAKLTEISEISITPHCTHPVDVVELLVGGTNVLLAPTSSTGTMTFQFSKRSARDIIVTLRQRNALITQVEENPKIREASILWQDRIGQPYEALFAEEDQRRQLLNRHSDSIDRLAGIVIRNGEEIE